MNEAIQPLKKPEAPAPVEGVHVSLGALVRLRALASGFSFLPRQPVNSILAGRHASRLRGRGLNFDEIRRYLPGDDIRQMDWKVTARTRVPHTRIYTEEHGRPALLVVDQRMSMHFGSVRNFKSVTAAEVAAIAAWRVIAMKDEVGAIVFGDADFDVIKSGGGKADVMRLLNAIVTRNHALSIGADITPGPHMLNEALRRAEQLARHDTLVVVISDGIGHDEATRGILSRIARHNDVLVAIVSDPLEVELPSAGPRIFASGGLQLEVDTGKRAIREGFRNDFNQRADEARKFLIQREVPLMRINTVDDVPLQIRRLLGGRAKR